MIFFGQQSNFRPIPSFSELQTAKMLGIKNLEIIALTSLIYQSEQSSTNNNMTLSQSSAIMPTFGFISVYGLKNKLDLRARLNFLFPDDKFRSYLGDKYTLYEFSCGGKINLITNKLALCTDFNMQQHNVPEFDDYGQSTYRRIDFIPTLLYTFSLKNNNSVTLGIKHFHPLNHSSDYTTSSLSPPYGSSPQIENVQSFGSINCNMVFNLKDWRLIPEISLLHAYGQNDVAPLPLSPPSTNTDPSIPSGDFFITPFYLQVGIGVSKIFSAD